MSALRLSLAALCIASLAACGDASVSTAEQWHGVGGSNPPSASSGGGAGAAADAGAPKPGSGNPQSGSFTVLTASPSADVELRNVTQPLLVTVAPTGFSGAVSLSVTGLPAGVTASFDKSSVTVSGTTGASAQLTLTTKSDVISGAIKLSVVATSGATTATAPLTLNVKPVLTIAIPMNVDAMKGTPGNASTKAFGDFPIVVSATANLSAAPIVVKFLNKDSSGHCIHASNMNQGFPHDPSNNGVCNALTQKDQFNATARAINATGTYKFWLHDQGDLTEGAVKVQ